MVILHLLEDAGFAKRTRKGFVRKVLPPTPLELEQLLAIYTARASQDKERLAEMMHYAETPQCRTQVLRTHFGEDEGVPCGRCDNCERNAEEAARAEAHAMVTTVDTIHGWIQTTSPETLPPTQTDAFAVGESVKHKRFGTGKVKDVHGDNVLVRFEKCGEKRVMVGFLKRAAAIKTAGAA